MLDDEIMTMLIMRKMLFFSVLKIIGVIWDAIRGYFDFLGNNWGFLWTQIAYIV